MLVVAARLTGELPQGLMDSKQLSKQKRETIFRLLPSSFHFGEGWVEPGEIDELGLSGAMRVAVARALLALGATFEERIIMDGNVNYCPAEFTAVEVIPKADDSHAEVSAASIYAKVARDKHMVRAARFYPFYGFERHVGYGTAVHKSALKVHGISKLHRKSYKPVAAFA